MKKFLIFFPILFIFLTLFATAQESCIYYFYGISCPHCANVAPFLDKLKLEYSNINIIKFETYQNISNQNLLDTYFESYNLPKTSRGVPIIFISDNYLVGDTPIISDLESLILKNPNAKCPPTKSNSISTIEIILAVLAIIALIYFFFKKKFKTS